MLRTWNMQTLFSSVQLFMLNIRICRLFCLLPLLHKLAAWMQRKLELKTGIRLQLLFSLLPLLSYCLLLSMLFSLLLLSLALLPLFCAAPEFLPCQAAAAAAPAPAAAAAAAATAAAAAAATRTTAAT